MYYTEAKAAADAQLLAAKKVPKNYILLDSDDQADVYLIKGTLENLPAGAKRPGLLTSINKVVKTVHLLSKEISYIRIYFLLVKGICLGQISWCTIKEGK